MAEIHLNRGQVMTLRVALESFWMDLCMNGLGDDKHGQAMVEAYKARIAELRPIIAHLEKGAD